MSCFSCSPRTSRRKARGRISSRSISRLVDSIGFDDFDKNCIYPDQNSANKFPLSQLANATRNFSQSNWIGEGGFGRVYKGHLESGETVAIKQLKQNGLQGTQEFVVECLMLTLLHHENLVRLIGYCAEGDERILVYEYMSQGSLETHLFNLPPERPPLDWPTRMSIALGAARGLSHLHSLTPPVIFRDLKSSNILLSAAFLPKLADFGLAKLGPTGDRTHVSTRVMGTYGYCAPEYVMSGRLSVKSDVFGFGVVLLELVSGRKAFDGSRERGEQSLVAWSRPFLNSRGYMRLADPLLNGCYPHRPLFQLAEVISHCLAEQAHMRPSMSLVTSALEHIASQPYDPSVPSPRNKSNMNNIG